MERRDQYLGIVLAGWVMAFVLPIGGLIAGLLLAERRTGHAVGMGVVSVASGFALAYGWTQLFG